MCAILRLLMSAAKSVKSVPASRFKLWQLDAGCHLLDVNISGDETLFGLPTGGMCPNHPCPKVRKPIFCREGNR